jgi:hypothetical protein
MIQRASYAKPAWRTVAVDLDFSIHAGATRVESTLQVERWSSEAGSAAPLVLDRGAADVMRLVSVTVNGAPAAHELGAEALTLTPPPAAAAAGKFVVHVVTEVNAEANSALEGLYFSGGSYVTQCEATGFRSITFAQVCAQGRAREGERTGAVDARRRRAARRPTPRGGVGGLLAMGGGRPLHARRHPARRPRPPLLRRTGPTS